LSGGWTAIAFLSFCLGNLWLPWAAPLGTILLTALGLQLEEQAQKQQLMTLFAQHLSPALAEDLWQRRQEIFQEGQLAAKELTATVLFIDIRGFSLIAEQLTSKQLLRWLNRYFDEMTQGIESQGGIIDKYIGDAIMAVFGLPEPRSDPQGIQQDALQAVATGLNLCKRLEHLNQILQKEKQPLIRVGIGIHTGEVIAGSIGGQKRLNYSVVGDTVNIAARLEAMNKTIDLVYPYPLLMSTATVSLIQDHYTIRFLGEFVLPGKAIATPIYTVTGKIPQTTMDFELG
jgi:adenylate cyclase